MAKAERETFIAIRVAGEGQPKTSAGLGPRIARLTSPKKRGVFGTMLTLACLKCVVMKKDPKAVAKSVVQSRELMADIELLVVVDVAQDYCFRHDKHSAITTR